MILNNVLEILRGKKERKKKLSIAYRVAGYNEIERLTPVLSNAPKFAPFPFLDKGPRAKVVFSNLPLPFLNEGLNKVMLVVMIAVSSTGIFLKRNTNPILCNDSHALFSRTI